MSRRNDAPASFRELMALMERLRRASDPSLSAEPVPLGVSQVLDFDEEQAQSAGRRPKPRQMSAEECWVPSGGSAEVGGYDIGGMVYVGAGLMDQSGRSVENCLINPALPVATRIVREAIGAAYSPSYSLLSPSDRLGYLRWLASGRSDPNVAPPFLRLYLFGLERRLMLDEPSEKERAELIAELERLQGLYDEEYGLDQDLRSLLDCVAALTPERLEPEPDRMIGYNGRELPPWLAVGLGYRIAKGQMTDGRWLLCWWLAQPATRLRVAERRIFGEFATLFSLRYAQRYPKGLKVTVPNAASTVVYVAASGTFKRPLSGESASYPDISRIRQPLRIAKRIADECWQALAPFSRFVGRKPAYRDTIEGHVLLPTDLAIHRPNDDLRRLHQWADRQVDRPDDDVFVSDVLRVFEGSNAINVRKRRLVVLSNALALGGIGLAPDARFTGRLPNLGDRVALFRLPKKLSNPPEMSPHYLRTLYIMQLVVFVAKADGSVSEAKWQAMDTMIRRRPRLRAADKARLQSDLRWLAWQWQGTVSIKKRCQMLHPKELDEVRDLAVKVACADGVVDPAQVRAVQKLYRAMGRPQDDAFANLHRRSAKAPTRPVTVRKPSRPHAGHFLPRRAGGRPARVPRSVHLDDGRISRIVADTQKVSKVLSEVFLEEEPETAPAGTGAADAPVEPAAFEGLDPSHSALVERLLKRPRWSEPDFERLVQRCGLMAGGALEAVNEWSFEKFGEALLEDDADLTLNPDVLQALQGESEMVPDAEA